MHRNIKHGHRIRVNGKKVKSPTYLSWCKTLERCYNPNEPGYKRYGGKGVCVCERWRGKDGFAHFLQDLGERPDGTTLGRFGDEGHYEPSNCRWMTYKEQGEQRSAKYWLRSIAY